MAKKNAASELGSRLAQLGAAKGGQARAEALSPDARREIARFAAEKRWGSSVPRETHVGILRIGDRELPCAVLDNGLRVFSASGLRRAIGSRKRGVNVAADRTSPQLPPFLARPSVRAFIPDDLMAPLISPVAYRSRTGGRAVGYEATLLPRICGVILDADKAGAMGVRGRLVVETAEAMLRGFATVGIIALIDEATGYQADRARDELSKILEAYIAPELRPWASRFPSEFFKQIYRLHGWEYKPGNLRGPRYVGKLVNKLIYDPLPPGVVDEIRTRNPPNEKGQRKYRHHQFLTEDIGEPHLERQIVEVTTLMRVSDDKPTFERLFQKAFPKKGQALQLQLAVVQDDEE